MTGSRLIWRQTSEPFAAVSIRALGLHFLMAAGETSSISPTFPVVEYRLWIRFGARARDPAVDRMEKL
jgi:hypothetical protein